MRFSLFAHMERWDTDVSHRQLMENLVELVQLAEDGGFSTVWTGEHHAMEYTVSPSPMPVLAYLAAKTTTIRLGAGTLIAPFWNPIRAAGESALVDVISNGRLELGIARGAYQFEFDRLARGMPAAAGAQHLRELLPAMQALWQGDYAHDGEIWQFPTSTSVPKPVQDTIPIWVAARSPESHEFAVENGFNIMVTPLMKDDAEVADLTDKTRAAVEKFPGSKKPEVMCLRHTYVHADDDPDGWRAGAAAINRYYRSFDAWAGNKTTPTNGFLDPSPEEKFADRPEFELESLHKSAMIGTPDEIVARITHYQELGVDEFSYWIDNGMSHDEKKKSLKLFVKEVVPGFSA